eukprot:TRINITY_DN30041_c0_g1_i2.p1 TRINITY_DN30041_c0_g1~~TRINITY_DN30041_c0_g1_i2.p1  ORF type:complete len:387 (-),score=42.57 TRINITY_DN30041_c0_g1_i2:47-1207(-)
MSKEAWLLVVFTACSMVSAKTLRFARASDHLGRDSEINDSSVGVYPSVAKMVSHVKQQPLDIRVKESSHASLADETKEVLLSGAPAVPRGKNQKQRRRVVWIVGYPRSATSTLLSMVSAGEHGSRLASTEAQNSYLARGYDQTPGKTFSLFEPCHFDDDLGGQSCSAVLKKITDCDFSGIVRLTKWADPHTTNNGTAFDPKTAKRLCDVSDVLAFKTISVAHPFTDEWLDLVEAVPNMQVLNVVRDPRAILSSWKAIPAFQAKMVTDRNYSLAGICESYLANGRILHRRILDLQFEELMLKPRATVKSLRHWLKLPFGKAQEAWVNRTFDAEDCPQQPQWFQGFDDCHKNSTAKLNSWRRELTKATLRVRTMHQRLRKEAVQIMRF